MKNIIIISIFSRFAAAAAEEKESTLPAFGIASFSSCYCSTNFSLTHSLTHTQAGVCGSHLLLLLLRLRFFPFFHFHFIFTFSDSQSPPSILLKSGSNYGSRCCYEECGVLVLMFGECYEQMCRKRGKNMCQPTYIAWPVLCLCLCARTAWLLPSEKEREERAEKSHIKYETDCLQKVRGRERAAKYETLLPLPLPPLHGGCHFGRD